jgi:hypothetical protein
MRKQHKVLAKGLPKKTHPFFERILTVALASDQPKECKKKRASSIEEDRLLCTETSQSSLVNLPNSQSDHHHHQFEHLIDPRESKYQIDSREKDSQIHSDSIKLITEPIDLTANSKDFSPLPVVLCINSNSEIDINKTCTNNSERKINAFSLLLQKRGKSSSNAQCISLSPIFDLGFYGNWEFKSTANNSPSKSIRIFQSPAQSQFRINLKAPQVTCAWKEPKCHSISCSRPNQINSCPQLLQWLALYKARRNQTSYDSDGEELFSLAQEEDFVRNAALLLCSSDEIASKEVIKSSASEIGFSLLEIDCSSKRDGDSLIRTVQEGTKSKRNVFSPLDSSGCSDSLIVIQGIESVFPSDQGFFSALSTIAASSKRPMIFTSTFQPRYWDWTFLRCAECVVLESCSFDSGLYAEGTHSFLLSGFNRLIYEAFQVQCSLQELARLSSERTFNEFQPENETVFPRKIFLHEQNYLGSLDVENVFSLPFSFDCNAPARGKKSALDQSLVQLISTCSSTGRNRKNANKQIN